MAQKPDYYEVLGVDKKATEPEIKKAYQKVVMMFHPDRHRSKSDAEKKAFLDEKIKSPDVRAAVSSMENFVQLASEAEKVLTDKGKRLTYDSYGHKGLENAAAGRSGGQGQSWADAAGPVKMKTYSEESTFDFFDKASERIRKEAAVDDDGLTPEQRRANAREARRNRRNRGNGDDFEANVQEQPVQTPVAPQADFKSAVSDVKNASDKLRSANQSGAVIPLDTLEAFRDNLADFMKEVDTAITQAKKAPKSDFKR